MNKESKKIGLVGYASGFGAVTPGTELGPQVYRSRGLIESLEQLGHQVKDFGDTGAESLSSLHQNDLGSKNNTKINIEFTAEERQALNLEQVYLNTHSLYTKTTEILQQNYFPLILGGDHSLPIGSSVAISNYYQNQGKKLGMIWIDCHTDLHTPQSSISKKIFGMSAAIVLGKVSGGLSSLQKRPVCSMENFCYVGIRDVEQAEKDTIKKDNIPHFTMKDIDIKGIYSVVKEAISIASNGTEGFIVSFDLDVCDPHLVPGTGTRMRGGLTYREAQLTMELIYDSQKMLGLEMVELNPSIDKNFKTADFAISLMESAMGKSIL